MFEILKLNKKHDLMESCQKLLHSSIIVSTLYFYNHYNLKIILFFIFYEILYILREYLERFSYYEVFFRKF